MAGNQNFSYSASYLIKENSKNNAKDPLKK